MSTSIGPEAFGTSALGGVANAASGGALEKSHRDRGADREGRHRRGAARLLAVDFVSAGLMPHKHHRQKDERINGFAVYNATSGTCYIAPAAIASPCAAATPVPVAGASPAGWPIPAATGAVFPYSQFGSTGILDSEWDVVCASAGSFFENAVP